MTAAIIVSVLLAFALGVALLRLRAVENLNHRLDSARRVMAENVRRLRADITTLTAERDHVITERDNLVSGIADLRDQLDKGLRWRNELRQAAVETAYLMAPPPQPNYRGKADAWASQMEARFAAPAVIPPHEQDGNCE